MPKGKRKEVQLRIAKVEDMLLNHFTEAMIIRVGTADWGVKPRTIRDYISQVRERWTKENEDNRQHKKAASVNRLMRLARRLNNAPTEVLKVEKLLADIEGTKAPLQVEQETSLDVSSRGREAVAAFAQALGVPLEEIEDS